MIITSGGVKLIPKRIDRRVLDAFALRHPLPQPPKKLVTLFGGYKEEIDDLEDPTYQQAMLAYSLLLAEEQLDLLAEAVDIVGDYADYELYAELCDLGVIPADDKVAFLKYVALPTDNDVARLVEEIRYLSTVTDRGIAEAMQLFNATWSGIPIERAATRHSPASYSRYYADREAARFAGYRWDDFCRLSGREQSYIVAHFDVHQRLEYQNANWRQTT